MRAVIWGTGIHCVNTINNSTLNLDDVVAFTDSNKEKWGEFFFNKRIIPPEEIFKYDFNTIIIGSRKHYDEIYKVLIHKFNIKNDIIESIDKYALLSEKQEDTHLVEYRAQKIDSITSIPSSCLLNTRVLFNREAALDYIPQHTIVAEVGVAFGDFSRKIIDIIKPNKFYAIDFFDENIPGFWGKNYFERDNMTHQQWYENRFKNELDLGIVEIRRGYSWEVLEAFEDNYFDYVYLDAAHDYESVKKDIGMLVKKIKRHGIIQFNDYVLYDVYTHVYYGVVAAVNEFISNTNSEVLYYCFQNQRFDDIVVSLNK